MEKRQIGSLSVTVVGLGTNNFGFGMEEAAVAPVVDAALDAGINLFDTADSYGESEGRLGRALGRRREEVVIATKFASRTDVLEGGASPRYIHRAVERSLQQLGTDRIDLYQIHRPDPKTPIADTLGALDELVRAGKVREIGCSNFSVDQLRAAEAAVVDGAARFVSVQNHYNLLHRDDEADVLPECVRLDVAYVPFFPLASGVLTGKYRREEPAPSDSRLGSWGSGMAPGLLTAESFDAVERLTAWAADRGHTVAELAIAWLAAKPAVASVIAGATRVDQVGVNAAAANWRLTDDEVAEIDGLTG